MRVRVVRPNGLEVLTLVLVIAIVCSFVFPRSFRLMIHRRAMAASEIDAIETALAAYRVDTEHYPTTAEGLSVLMAVPARRPGPLSSRGPYLLRPIPADPWGHPYVYRRAEAAGGDGYTLSSNGADGRPGGEGEDADVILRR